MVATKISSDCPLFNQCLVGVSADNVTRLTISAAIVNKFACVLHGREADTMRQADRLPIVLDCYLLKSY